MPSLESQLDAKLRAVPLPNGLLERLRAVTLADDDGLDSALREVPMPRGLLQRLRQVPALTDDEGMDQALRNVPAPMRRIAVLRRHAARQDRWLRIGRFTVAASVIAALTLSYVAVLLTSAPRELAVGPLPVTASPLEQSWDGELPEDHEAAPPLALPAELGFTRIEPRVGLAPGGPLAVMPPGADPLATPAPERLLATNDMGNDVLKPAPGLTSRGLDLPPASVLHNGRSFITASRAPLSIIPLDVDTASYELARRHLERGLLPPSREVRIEDFLAAMDYEFPLPQNRDLGVTVAAGPSPFGGEGLCLLQVGVRARQPSERPRDPVHLVLAVDTSTSMAWGSRIQMVRAALQDLVKQLDPSDRLSLVSFSGQGRLLAQDVGPGPFLDAVKSLAAAGNTNAASGLNEAFSLAQEQSGAGLPAARVVLLTDGQLDLGMDPPLQARIQRRAADAARQGVTLHVIDLAQSKESDPSLAALAEVGRGTLHHAGNANQVGWAFREILTGQSQWVAHDVQLKVTFDKGVEFYRLLGHERRPEDLGGPGNPRADFRAGQSAAGLYELRVSPTGSGRVATVELTWYKTHDGPRNEKDLERITLQVERKQFAPLFSGSAPSLQQAALAAQTAEVLHSKWPLPMVHAALRQVLDVARQVDSRVYQGQSFVPFLTLVDQAKDAKPIRSRR